MSALHLNRITRNRASLTCIECRKRKLKCDKKHPCSACSRRDDQASCQYDSGKRHDAAERKHRDLAEVKLAHLEQLVQQISSSSPSDHVSPLIQAREVGDGASHAYDIPDHTAHNGATHWSAMLEDIEQLRQAMFHDQPEAMDDGDNEQESGSAILFGSGLSLTLAEVMTQFLPSRQQVDRLVSSYFRTQTVVAPFLHATQFTRLYASFWLDPLSAPPLWSSLLFSICHIAGNTISLGRDDLLRGNEFSTAAAHCLTVGRYHKAQHYSVEALLLFIQSRFLTDYSFPSDIGSLFGVLIRLATHQGYHRDAQLSRFSPFEGEMRRRTWSLCMQLDLLVSFQLGIPSSIQVNTWDTRCPSNLLDSDFDENSKVLPSARPDTEVTPMMFYIVKHRLMAVFGRILQYTLSVGQYQRDDLEDLDQELSATYLALPEVFLPVAMANSIADSPIIRVARLCVLFIYQKCRCVLHRRHAVQRRANSVQCCQEAALSIVGFFIELYEECKSGGQMEVQRWFTSAITWYDFLLGVTTLCLVLCVGGGTLDDGAAHDLLLRVQTVCKEQETRSGDTKRVLGAVDATLLRLGQTRSNGHYNDQVQERSVTGTSNRLDVSAQWFGSEGGPASAYDQSAWPDPSFHDYFESSTVVPTMDDPSWYLDQYLQLPR